MDIEKYKKETRTQLKKLNIPKDKIEELIKLEEDSGLNSGLRGKLQNLLDIQAPLQQGIIYAGKEKLEGEEAYTYLINFLIESSLKEKDSSFLDFI